MKCCCCCCQCSTTIYVCVCIYLYAQESPERRREAHCLHRGTHPLATNNTTLSIYTETIHTHKAVKMIVNSFLLSRLISSRILDKKCRCATNSCCRIYSDILKLVVPKEIRFHGVRALARGIYVQPSIGIYPDTSFSSSFFLFFTSVTAARRGRFVGVAHATRVHCLLSLESAGCISMALSQSNPRVLICRAVAAAANVWGHTVF